MATTSTSTTCRSYKANRLLLLRLALVWLLAFLLGKLAFILRCHGNEAVSLADVGAVLWHGLPMDLSSVAYLLVLPFLCLWRSPWRILRIFIIVFNIIAAIAVAASIVGDCALYPFWGFKLDATIWTYIDSPKEVVASVSVWFVVAHLVAFILFAAGLSYLTIPPKEETSKQEGGEQAVSRRRRSYSFLKEGLLVLLIGTLLIIAIRGGVKESTMNVGNAYFSERQFLNHAAVNPFFSILSSSFKTEHFNQLYRAMDKAEADSLLKDRYPLFTTAPTDSAHLTRQLLKTDRPNVLLIIWEGCGGQFTTALGGQQGVVPCLDSLISRSIFFNQLYANSFRTDRGVLCALSGQLSYPTHSLMKMAKSAAKLPSIARNLKQNGYETAFTYGGDINFTNMKGYLLSTGYEHIKADVDFTLEERHSAEWGVADSIVLHHLYNELIDRHQQSDKPWLETVLTLSSHEPFDVPDQDEDPVHAAFHYADRQIGRFINKLQESPLWDNLLVILLPDHGIVADSVIFWTEPDFFHIPMIWTGGATREPQAIETIMNQSDLPATLLAQMNIAHSEFPWSRNVLSNAYRHPFAYATFNDGFTIIDSSLSYITFMNIGQFTFPFGQAYPPALLRLGQAIQQASYDQLEDL